MLKEVCGRPATSTVTAKVADRLPSAAGSVAVIVVVPTPTPVTATVTDAVLAGSTTAAGTVPTRGFDEVNVIVVLVDCVKLIVIVRVEFSPMEIAGLADANASVVVNPVGLSRLPEAS